MASPANPTPAIAPPRLPSGFVAATGVAVPGAGAGVVFPWKVVPPTLGAALTVLLLAAVLVIVFVFSDGVGVLHPRQNAFSKASPDEACTPPRITLNDPPPVNGPATMSKIVM